jgi:hypothetical protein
MSIQLTNDQQNAVDFAIDHYSRRLPCIIQGGPGTGKTVIANEIRDRLGIICVAPTNSAASNIKGQTVTRFLNQTPWYDATGKLHFAQDVPESRLPILLDEMSMVSAANIRSLHTQRNIYVGDFNQLPPVKEDQSILEEMGLPTYALTAPMRFNDPDLIEALEKIRVASSPLELVRSVGRLPRIHKRKAALTTTCLSYSNAVCHLYNSFYTSHHDLDPIYAGQPLLSDRTDSTMGLYASEDVFVISVCHTLDPRFDEIVIGWGAAQIMAYRLLTDLGRLEDSQVRAELSKQANSNAWAQYYKQTELNWTPYFSRFRTIHKAQGKTLDSCSVDLSSILRANGLKIQKQLLTVALSRAKNKTYIVE